MAWAIPGRPLHPFEEPWGGRWRRSSLAALSLNLLALGQLLSKFLLTATTGDPALVMGLCSPRAQPQHAAP